jgi:uncharacterized protein with ACT and thioredoxin-like domain
MRERRRIGAGRSRLGQAFSRGLVVCDSLKAGVMAVMAVASTARFDLARVRGVRF